MMPCFTARCILPQTARHVNRIYKKIQEKISSARVAILFRSRYNEHKSNTGEEAHMKRFDITFFFGPDPKHVVMDEVIADMAASGILLK